MYSYLLLYLVPSIISIISLKLVNIQGTDQYYHMVIIKAIKENRNRFILENPSIIGKNRMAYPQFLHWILSFFDNKNITKYAIWINLLSTILSSIFLFFFVYHIVDLSENIFLITNKSKILLLTGLAYISFPFNYDMVNAKNTGISARGIGLCLGQLFLYIISIYLITANPYLLLVLVPVCILILISSAFAMQFLLFGSILISLATFNFYLLIPLLASFLVIYLVSKSFFKTYFFGQFSHKKLYSNYLAERYILKLRYSIWRDLFYDFWVLILDKKVSIVEKLKYIASNSFVVAVSSMPFIFLAMFYSRNLPLYISIPAIVCFVIFILTTFRKTRFLGEPERYLEFGFGFFSLIVAISFFKYDLLYYILLIYSICFVLFRLGFYINYARKNKNVIGRNNAQEAKLYLESLINKENQKDVNVLSNSTQYSKILLTTKWKTFWHPLFQEKIGGFHFKELFSESYDLISQEKIKEIIKTLNVHYFLCDLTKINNNQDFVNKLSKNNIELDFINAFGDDIKLYKVCLKS